MANQAKWQPKLREITEELKKKWAEYLIQIFIIFFSITISFSVDKWKDANKRKETEQEYLKSLLEDMKADSLELKNVITETKLVIEQSEGLLEATKNPKLGKINDSVFNNAIKIIFKRPRFIANDATFSELRSSGNTQNLASFALKNALFKYYNRYEAIKNVESAEQQATISVTGLYITKRFSLIENFNKNTDIQAILNDIEFGNNVFIRLSNRQELLAAYEQILQENNKLQTEIAKDLK